MQSKFKVVCSNLSVDKQYSFKVYNIVPSISAITGISPQRYLWRVSVAFHIGPRFIIAVVHRAYHISLIQHSGNLEVNLLYFYYLSDDNVYY